MGVVFASCGHPLPQEADITEHAYWWTEPSNRGLCYGVLCDGCAEAYEAAAIPPGSMDLVLLFCTDNAVVA